MDLEGLISKISEAAQPEYWRFVAENDGDCCEKCKRFDGKVFSDEDPAKPELPIHPNCRCSWRKATIKESAQAMEILAPKVPSFAGKNLVDVVQKIKNIYDFKIPKPPRETNNKANLQKENKEVEQEKGLKTGNTKTCSILLTIPENKNRMVFPA